MISRLRYLAAVVREWLHPTPISPAPRAHFNHIHWAWHRE
jgi:hypothetical protein